MLFVAIILLPFYIFRKKNVQETKIKVHYSKMPWWKGAVYCLSLGLLFIVAVIWKSTNTRFGILGIVILSVCILIYSRAKKITLKKKGSGFGFYFAEEAEDLVANKRV